MREKASMQIFNATYRGIQIKSDSRVHLAVLDVLTKVSPPIGETTSLLDVATGKGALAQRLIDRFPGILLDCNDLNIGVQASGFRKAFSKDLNTDFDFKAKYDVVLAVEVIEHLENPFHFMRGLQRHLNPGGFILLTTPNIDSFFDRLWFLYHGYSYYFGARGVVNSEGHITMCPEWLLKHIAEIQNMDFEMVSDLVDSRGLIGRRGRLILALLSPLRFAIKNVNDRSGTICIFKNKKGW